MNGVTYENPDVPVLLQILSRAHRAQDLLPHGSIYPVNRGETVEIVLPGVEGAGTNVSSFFYRYPSDTDPWTDGLASGAPSRRESLLPLHLCSTKKFD